jgi:myosin-5
MQIQYNITRIEEWCKSHDMQENLIQLESLMQATKLLQLKKVRGIANRQPATSN